MALVGIQPRNSWEPRLPVGGGEGFSPRSITVDYFDTIDPSVLTLSGANPTEWRSSKGAIPATQATAGARPTYAATGMNGGPVVNFDGVDDFMIFNGALPFPVGADAGEIWFLGTQTALAADATPRYAASYGNNTYVRARGIRRGVTGGVNEGSGQVGNGLSNIFAVAPGDFSNAVVVRIEFTATEITASLNGVRGTPVAAVPSTLATVLTLGCGVPSMNFWQGGIAHVGFVAGILSDFTAAQYTAYLKARGGIA